MTSANRWRMMIENDPEHSHRYAQRWKDMAAAGHDLGGEARFLDAMAQRGSRIFDAGCGTGRVGGLLAAAGHDVVGVDLDPYLIAQAQRDFPTASWSVGDLEALDPQAYGAPFHIVFSAGNVLGFLDPELRPGAVARMAALLAPGGRLVTGFGAGRGYAFEDFLHDQRAAGLAIDLTLSTWDLRPFAPDAGFLVCVASRPEGSVAPAAQASTAQAPTAQAGEDSSERPPLSREAGAPAGRRLL
ncbi:class I SAM-dependent methyltransferase [Brevibacterium sp. BRM-1]|uniref:class I SAM-dependent methyltransferase n=1 Tax=Brevibacterium sp. BRM-1 TaxID=2999062 RepID=UPI002E0D20A0